MFFTAFVLCSSVEIIQIQNIRQTISVQKTSPLTFIIQIIILACPGFAQLTLSNLPRISTFRLSKFICYFYSCKQFCSCSCGQLWSSAWRSIGPYLRCYSVMQTDTSVLNVTLFFAKLLVSYYICICIASHDIIRADQVNRRIQTVCIRVSDYKLISQRIYESMSQNGQIGG